MKPFTTILSLLALATSISAQNTCTADDVLVSLEINIKFGDQMQTDVDTTNNSIDTSGPVYKNYKSLLNQYAHDVQCTINATQDQQTQICGAYINFSTSQLRFLHVADGLQFFITNDHGDNESKMHGYILTYQAALEGYTSRIKAGVPLCASQIDDAYAPLAKQLASLIQDYPASTST
ncbi:uncharacterized protein N7483_012552 [Penicillium malachiteum]|uniref:uncharacterized protein n=1 Tax=Penicillium malachiteum TaxID=1324776 RepID=UPI0025476D2B|nr:uncharacterized protein N7483_012552 [Penicillium malachiteum]KAJ5715371.1 hypothetical protein N7483_012552 [Penicillium malachiteum]